jgi:8-oxo-dGTP pyrophosphatase MutT (NUDIX family)
MNKVEIVEPSKKIFNLSKKIQREVKKILPESETKLIGSFAIPICGRKEIDILVEVKDVKKAQEKLAKLGFKKGPVVRGEAFLTKFEEDMRCDLHVLEYGDKRIRKVYEKVINFFKENKEAREKYSNFRKSLAGLSESESEYKEKKSNFLAETVFAEWNKVNKKIMAIIYSDKNKFLLLRTNPKWLKVDEWFVVTGSIEKDEEKEEAVKREVLEETGLKILEIKKTGSSSDYEWPIGSGKMHHETIFLVKVQYANPKLSGEHLDFRWLNKEDFIEQIDWKDKKELRSLLK